MNVRRPISGWLPEHRQVLADLYRRRGSVSHTAVALGIPPSRAERRLRDAIRQLAERRTAR